MHRVQAFSFSLFTFKGVESFALAEHGQRLRVKELVIPVNVLEVFPESAERQVGVADAGLGAVGRPAGPVNMLGQSST